MAPRTASRQASATAHEAAFNETERTIMMQGRAALARSGVLLALALAASCTAVKEDPAAAGKARSRPVVGELMPIFYVHAITGPDEGTVLCYI
jgi:hypothetical protein